VSYLEKYILPCLFITLLSFLFYFHVLGFSYTYLDDAPLVIDSLHQFTANPFSIFQVFIKNTLAVLSPQYYYRPVLAVSFMLNSVLGANYLSGYYLVNIILHALTACSIFMLLVRLRYAISPALLLSLFYVIHPIMVPTVAWMPGRNDTLLTIFSIFSFLAFMNFIEKTKLTDYFLHLFFLLLALFTKENGLCLIVVSLLYMHLVLKMKWFCFKENVLITGWFFTLTLWFLMRHMALAEHSPATAASIYAMFHSMMMNSIVLLQYLGRIFFPFHLSVWPTIQDSQWITGVIALALLAMALFFSKEAKPDKVLFGIAWFILFLVPTLTGPHTGPAACFFDHRVCISMPGMMILLAETDVIKHFNIKKKRYIFLISCMFIFYSLIAFEHSYDYRNSAAFWNNAQITSPHSWRNPDSLPIRPDH
jgi:protein O-mannosyl-transferase